MVFNFEDLFNKSAQFINYSLQPFPPYFLSYSWGDAEKEADENIRMEKFGESESITKLIDGAKTDSIRFKNTRTARFERDFRNIPDDVREKLIKSVLPLFLTDPESSDISAKKVAKVDNRWFVNIDFYYKFTFEINNKRIILRCLGPRSSG